MGNNLSLSEIFNKKIFRIPDYQRGYAWQNPQLNDFWEDLVNLSSGRKHYTGLISWKVADEKELANWNANEKILKKHGFKFYYVVDGQQRLTTFLILLNSIIQLVSSLPENKDKDDNFIDLECETIAEIKKKYISQKVGEICEVYIFGYDQNNPNSDYLKYNIFGEGSPGSIEESYYTKNLQNAKMFYKNKVEDYYKQYGIEGINKLYSKLTNDFIFYTQDINDDYDVCVAFETMNNRGKSLSNLELLKNRLIYLTTLYEDKDLGENSEETRLQLRRNINDAWREIYYQLGRKTNYLLADDEFLRAHWIIYYTYTRTSGNDYKDFLLNRFSCKSVYNEIADNCTVQSALPDNIYPERNIDDATDDEVVTDVIEKKHKKLTFVEINEYVKSLREIVQYWFYSFYPEENNNISNEEKNWIMRLNHIGISYFRPLVAVAIRDTRANREDKVNLFKAIERFIFVNFRLAQYFSNYKSSDFYRAAKDLYYKKISINNVINDLEYYTNQKLADALVRFASRIDGLFEDEKGFYGWKNLTYFLYEYEEYLADKEDKKVSWESLQNKDTIEHILPQEYSNEYWKKAYELFTKEEMNHLVSSLGNFLVLSRSVNSKLQNYAFPVKKRERYCKGSYSEIEVANGKSDDWLAQDIYDRGLKLLNFMNDRWCLGMSDEVKKQLLHLEFLNKKEDGVFTG